jgi:hypothetical protein
MRRLMHLFVVLLLFCAGQSAGETRSIISNLANPAIGFVALFRGDVAPQLDRPYGIQFEESEINLVSVVDPYWTLYGNVVFAPDGAFPEEVYATSVQIPSVQLKVGLLRASFGKHGLLHTHAFPFVDAPEIMANTIGGEGFKDAGVEAGWLTPLPWYCELTVGGYQAVGPDGDHPLDLGATSHGNIPSLGHLKNLVDLTDNTTMEIGGSGLTGMGDDGLHHTAWGADLTFRNVPLRRSNQRGWILQGEYIGRGSSGKGRRITEAEGWYASFQYRWAQDWWTGLRVEDARHVTTDVLDQQGGLTGLVRKMSVNTAWVASEFSFIRAEYSVALLDPDDGSERIIDQRGLLQMCFTIGFHPPHAY